MFTWRVAVTLCCVGYACMQTRAVGEKLGVKSDNPFRKLTLIDSNIYSDVDEVIGRCISSYQMFLFHNINMLLELNSFLNFAVISAQKWWLLPRVIQIYICKICKPPRTIFSVFYKILPPHFAILLILRASLYNCSKISHSSCLVRPSVELKFSILLEIYILYIACVKHTRLSADQ